MDIDDDEDWCSVCQTYIVLELEDSFSGVYAAYCKCTPKKEEPKKSLGTIGDLLRAKYEAENG